MRKSLNKPFRLFWRLLPVLVAAALLAAHAAQAAHTIKVGVLF